VLLLKNLLFTIVIPGTVAVYVPLWIANTHQPRTGVTGAVAIALLTLGALIYAWCIWDFATFGRGTPAPIDAPKKLVVRGLYHYTRNPMYVGVLTVIVGWAVLFQTKSLAIYALIVALCFHLFVLFYEEPRLRHQFGKDYENYRVRVGRWLPKLRWPSA